LKLSISRTNSKRFARYEALAILILMISGSVLRVSAITTYSVSTQATLTEWTVPTPTSGPWALTLDPTGKCCWFLEYYGNKVGHLDPNNNTFQEWTIPTLNANPYSLATSSASGSLTLWGTEAGRDKVFTFSPSSELFQEYSLGLGVGTSGIGGISVEPSAQVRVWVTETFKNTNVELVYDPNTGNVTAYTNPFPKMAGGGAYGVYAGANSVWYAGFSALVRWDRAGQQYTIWPLPTHGSALGRSVTLDQYGQAWYTQGVSDSNSTDNYVGVLRGNNSIQEWQISTPGADPRRISIDPVSERPWVAEESQQADNATITTMDTYGGTIVPSVPTTAPSVVGNVTILSPSISTAIVSSTTVAPATSTITGSTDGQFIRFPFGSTQPHEAIVDANGNIWISEPSANKIARLSLSPDFALLTPPVISLPQGGTAIITVTGASISNYSGKVSLGITSPRSVIASNFSLNPISFSSGKSASSEFTINVAPNASGGLTPILIQGTDGSISHAISLILVIPNSTSLTASTASNTTSTTMSTTPKCLIATATYGSELSPEVQLLRNFRDNSLAKSKIGASFLIVFNAWYYSFSPRVANYINDHLIARAVMKSILYPLISFIFLSSGVYTKLSAYPEFAAVVAGLLASALIGSFYIGLPLGLLSRRIRPSRSWGLMTWGIMLLTGISAILFAEILAVESILMISSSLTVLSAMFTSAALTAATISRKRTRIRNHSRTIQYGA